MNTDRAPAGGALEVRGVNLASDTSIRVTLVGVEHRYELGDAQGDAHGDFTQAFALPFEAAEGSYVLLASVGDLELVTAPLTIAGVAQPESEEGSLRDEDEPLLAPMPTFAPGVVPGQAPVQTQAAPSAPPAAAPAPTPWLPIASATALIIITGLTTVVLLRQRGVRKA